MAAELKGVNNSFTNPVMKDEFSSQIQLKSTEELFKPHPCRGRNVKIVLIILLVLCAVAVGFVIGYFIPKMSAKSGTPGGTDSAETADYEKKFKQMVDTKEMMHTLRFLTSRPHPATTPANEDLGKFIENKWKDYGFKVDIPKYDVPISFPQDDKPNMVFIINNDTKAQEYVIKGQLNMSSSTTSNTTFKYSPFLAYTPNATVEGELVYAGRGLLADFNELKKSNISVKGKIVIMGYLFGQVSLAQELGAIGVIIYSDPKYYAPEGHSKNDTYPNSPWLPPDAVQRLSMIPDLGDPYTPHLPSKKGMYRLPESKIKYLKIPAQTISYHDALHIMRKMGGIEVPQFMKGGFNIDYRFGPLMSNSNTSSIVRLEVHNQIRIKTVRNVIATIPGKSEPDRIVFIGNHRDAWTFGASDPSSGTTTLLEISRILSGLQKQGWQPKRTIKLCSWGGEEMALMGSHEWIQENDQLVRARGVAYLNTDIAVGGKYVLHVQSAPLLSEFIIKHTKKMPDPLVPSKTLFDTMLVRLQKSRDYPTEPEISIFKYVSDNFPFQVYSGVTTADFSFFYGNKNKELLYPLYHTQFDTFEWIEKFADPEFRHFQTMTQLLGGMVLELSDCSLLPFGVERFGKSVLKANRKLKIYSFTFPNANDTLKDLKQATDEFVAVAVRFENMKKELTGKENPLTLRMYNDQMASLERTFISQQVTTSPSMKTVLFNDRFLNIDNVIQEFKDRKNETESRDEALRFQFSVLMQIIRAATSLLKI